MEGQTETERRKPPMRTNLFRIADERGIRYTWLAERLGYTLEYLSRIKHGRVPITEEFRRRACTIFPDVDPDVLFFTPDGLQSNQMVDKQEVAV